MGYYTETEDRLIEEKEKQPDLDDDNYIQGEGEKSSSSEIMERSSSDSAESSSVAADKCTEYQKLQLQQKQKQEVNETVTGGE